MHESKYDAHDAGFSLDEIYAASLFAALTADEQKFIFDLLKYLLSG